MIMHTVCVYIYIYMAHNEKSVFLIMMDNSAFGTARHRGKLCLNTYVSNIN